MYQKYFKRIFDFCAAAGALIVLSPLLLILTVTGAIAMGGNPFFTQLRPGKKGPDGQEKIFRLIKFRSMSNRKGPDGKLLPDAQRLNRYGKLLRASSLDELPELINILKGDMSLVGPRPQLVRDMVFMTQEQRRRHDVRPGLTGLAQVNGRNCIAWEDKFRYDLTYIDSGITLWGDICILLQTVGKVLKHTDTVREGTASDQDLGDWLLEKGTVTPEEYKFLQAKAASIIKAITAPYRIYYKPSGASLTTSTSVSDFKPSPFSGLLLPGEPKSIKTLLARFYFWLLTHGNFTIFYILADDGTIAHSSYVLGACPKFSFMIDGDFEIGPCNTNERFRRQGLYSATLAHITAHPSYPNARFYMLVSETNIPSIQGIEKAGFQLTGYAKRTRLRKHYCKCGDYANDTVVFL